MTFLELQNLTAFWLDDLQFGYFTPIQVKTWLNNAQKETQKLLIGSYEYWYLKCRETQLVVGQPDYILPDDFLKVSRLEVIQNVGLSSEIRTMMSNITLNQQDFIRPQAGFPEAYHLMKNRIVLYPTPDTIYTLRLNYDYKVTDMVGDAETPDIPDQYHEFLAVLAALDGLLKDGRDPSAMMAKREYYERMLKDDAEERTIDSPRQVVITGDDGYGALF